MRPYFLVLVSLWLGETALAPATAPPQIDPQRPRIEVCFVLDATGSMSGLIAGAKAKIWAIANQLVATQPRPYLKLGLVAYRDRGDEFVTKVFDLSDDIDSVYAHLQSIEADGGGDTPESVNQALYEAVHKVSWSSDRSVYKAIFLVGDCPPHMDYPDDVPYPRTCQTAAERDIVINTVQVGSDGTTTPIWKEIAALAAGAYLVVPPSGGMHVIATPFDDEIARLNVEVGKTIVAYGDKAKQATVLAKQARAEAAPAPLAADRLAFNVASGTVVQGGGDLVDAVSGGQVKLDELKEEDLPSRMRSLGRAERQAYLQEQAAKRAALQKQLSELLAKRRAYIEAEQAKAARGDAFDLQVAALIRRQAAKKGITYP